jgi:hypothetical protein
VKAIDDPALRQITEQLEHARASIRAVVEYRIGVLKRRFGCVKVRHKGLVKNGARRTTLFVLVKLWMARDAPANDAGLLRPPSPEWTRREPHAVVEAGVFRPALGQYARGWAAIDQAVLRFSYLSSSSHPPWRRSRALTHSGSSWRSRCGV